MYCISTPTYCLSLTASTHVPYLAHPYRHFDACLNHLLRVCPLAVSTGVSRATHACHHIHACFYPLLASRSVAVMTVTSCPILSNLVQRTLALCCTDGRTEVRLGRLAENTLAALGRVARNDVVAWEATEEEREEL